MKQRRINFCWREVDLFHSWGMERGTEKACKGKVKREQFVIESAANMNGTILTSPGVRKQEHRPQDTPRPTSKCFLGDHVLYQLQVSIGDGVVNRPETAAI